MQDIKTLTHKDKSKKWIGKGIKVKNEEILFVLTCFFDLLIKNTSSIDILNPVKKLIATNQNFKIILWKIYKLQELNSIVVCLFFKIIVNMLGFSTVLLHGKKVVCMSSNARGRNQVSSDEQ